MLKRRNTTKVPTSTCTTRMSRLRRTRNTSSTLFLLKVSLALAYIVASRRRRRRRRGEGGQDTQAGATIVDYPCRSSTWPTCASRRSSRSCTEPTTTSRSTTWRARSLNSARSSSSTRTVIRSPCDAAVPEVYAERAEIYIKLCDFSSAIANFKKALQYLQ